MFASKISVLSLFVFCLFTLGQAAPTFDSESTLLTRGIFKRKSDPATQTAVKHVIELANCEMLQVLEYSETKYLHWEQNMMTEKKKLISGGSKAKDHTVKEYAKQAKAFKKMAKNVASKIKGVEKTLKKLGIADAKSHCKSIKDSTDQEGATPTHTSSSSHATSTGHAN